MSNIPVPEITWKTYEYNANNPFKRKTKRTHIHCSLCNEDILPHGITKIEHWKKIRMHLRVRHNIDTSPEIPVRLLSTKLWATYAFSDTIGTVKK